MLFTIDNYNNNTKNKNNDSKLIHNERMNEQKVDKIQNTDKIVMRI